MNISDPSVNSEGWELQINQKELNKTKTKAEITENKITIEMVGRIRS